VPASDRTEALPRTCRSCHVRTSLLDRDAQLNVRHRRRTSGGSRAERSRRTRRSVVGLSDRLRDGAPAGHSVSTCPCGRRWQPEAQSRFASCSSRFASASAPRAVLRVRETRRRAPVFDRLCRARRDAQRRIGLVGKRDLRSQRAHEISISPTASRAFSGDSSSAASVRRIVATDVRVDRAPKCHIPDTPLSIVGVKPSAAVLITRCEGRVELDAPDSRRESTQKLGVAMTVHAAIGRRKVTS